MISRRLQRSWKPSRATQELLLSAPTSTERYSLTSESLSVSSGMGGGCYEAWGVIWGGCYEAWWLCGEDVMRHGVLCGEDVMRHGGCVGRML